MCKRLSPQERQNVESFEANYWCFLTGKHQADGCSSTIFKDDKQNLCKIRIQADRSSIYPNANYKEKGIFSFVCKIAGCSSLSDDIN